ncbi:MAG: hypothetical protein A2Y60_06155 [Chloroflexi bacterium RBG_13_54_9]|nr:MAG: hypothetical protein A2Y60_06155 [Chloroflexi bacterium RBG_13_54_9]
MPEPFGHIGWRQAREKARLELAALMALDRSAWVVWLTYLAICLYALTFAVLSVLEHESFNTHAFDLGNMDQAVWNTAHGRWLRFTNWEGGNTRLAAHVEPILFLIAPLYHLFSSPKTLLILQSVVISFGALPAFWLAKDLLKNDFAAVGFSVAYLLAPALETANLWDFHAVSLSSSFLLFAFYFIHKKRYILFFVFALLAMGTKEQVPLSVMLMGLYILLVQRNVKWGAFTTGVALVWVIIALGVIIPRFNPTQASPYLSRYDTLGASPKEILATFLSNPKSVLSSLSEPAKVEYVKSLFMPVVYLPLLSPLTLVFALPDLALNLLSSFPAMYSGGYHYGSVIVPFLIISAIQGTHLLARGAQRLSPKLSAGLVYILASLVLLSTLRSYVVSVFLPLADHPPVVTTHDELASRFIEMIPARAGVSANSTLNPHVSQREKLYLFPDIEGADYIFLDVTATPHPIDVPSLEWRVRELLQGGEWGVVAARDGYLLLKRGASETVLPEDFYSFAKAKDLDIRQRADVLFGDSLRLVGYNIRPSGKLHGRDPYASLTLFLRPELPLEHEYTIALFLVSDSGQIIKIHASNPTTTWYPSGDWAEGETVRVDLERVPLEGLLKAEIQVGVIKGTDPEDASARLTPVLSKKGSSLELRSNGTLVKLAELRAG